MAWVAAMVPTKLLPLQGVGDSVDRQLSVISVIFCSNPSQQFRTDVTGRTKTSHM